MTNFKIDRDKLIGVAFLAAAVGMIGLGSWLHINSRLGTFDTVVVHPFAQIAERVTQEAPTASGGSIIMGARYNEESSTFTFDMRADRDAMGDMPDRMFAVMSRAQIGCETQSDLLIDMNKTATIGYNIYDSEGGLMTAITLDQGSCSVLPTWVGRQNDVDSGLLSW